MKSFWTELKELLVVVAGFAVLTVAYTYPLAFRLGTYGYKLYSLGDTQWSVWNVGWVAHALLTDPFHVLDANIFYPHRHTLVYSEANLLAGAFAVPVLWLTNNAFAAHNFVVLLSFVLSATGAYYLVRYLTHDRRAASVAGIAFAFCPYVFGHLGHIQLLMTAGIPFSLLAFHRLADRPTPGRGVGLGLAMGAQVLGCAYYGIFVALMIGYASLLTAFVAPATNSQQLWKSRAYWSALGVGAGVSLLIVLPLFVPYLELQREMGFVRKLDESAMYAATWVSYLTSSAYVSRWMHTQLPVSTEVDSSQLFPGLITVVGGLVGAFVGWTMGGRQRFLALLYGSVGALALWESFGPVGGLYRLTYYLPAFSFLRAPSRFGIVVVMALTVLAGLAISEWLKRMPAVTALAPVLLLLVIVDQVTPIRFNRIDPIEPAYYALAKEPDGAVLEMPPRTRDFTRTQYMINSTVHWKPIVNAYSDVIPQSFYDDLPTLGTFPSREAFKILERDRVRYVTFDLREYDKQRAFREQLDAQLAEFKPYLRPVYADSRISVYEILRYPS